MRFQKALCALLLCCLLIGLLPLWTVQTSALTPTYQVSPSYKSSPYYTALTNVALTGNQREDIVNVALSQAGYKEGSKENDYNGADDGPYKNFCEYNYWYHHNVSMGMPFGGETGPWCATFVSWCAEQAGISDEILGRSVRASLGTDAFNIHFYSGSSTLNRTGDDNEQFEGYNYIPQRGDLFFSRKWTHVGLVVGVDGEDVITVEGNTNTDNSDDGYGVYVRTRKIEELYFGVPAYNAYTLTQAPPAPDVQIDRSSCNYGQTVTLHWNTASGAASYQVDVWQGETQLSSQNVGATLSYSFAPDATGNLSASVTAINDLGSASSKRVTFSVTANPKAVSGVSRLSGDTRYQTAIQAADEMKQLLGTEKFFSIIVASGENFADALSGSYLAAVKNAPILLVRDRDVEINAVKNYIRNHLAKDGTVYLLGGEKAVPKRMETSLKGYHVKRLGGATRFDTNIAILREAGISPGHEILIATGYGFADSLSASATGLPILLVNSENNKFSPAQRELMSTLPGSQLTIIGGTSAVSPELERALNDYAPTQRLSGANRYETSVLVAQRYFSNPDAMVVAYGGNFPDGLSGGPLAYICKAPLILTQRGKEASAAAYRGERGISQGYILGGTAVLPEGCVNTVFGKS